MKIIKRGDNLKHEIAYLAKHDDFILANYDFNLETQKIFFACLYKMNSNYVKPIINELSNIYKLDFEEIKKIVGIDYYFENNKATVKRATKDLTSKIVEIKTKNGFVMTGIVKSFRIDESDKTVVIEIDKEVIPYLVEKFKRFTKYGFKYLNLCQSKYTFRLYEILIMKAKDNDKKSKIVKISVDELRNTLQFPDSQSYGDLKKRVLEKAVLEFNAIDISNEKDREEKKLFKLFSYSEQIEKRRGRGRNPVSDVVFTFELLPETELLMMSKVEKVKAELDCEDWIITELRILIDKNKEREPYFNTLEINYIYSFVIKTIEDIKKEYNIFGNFNRHLLKKTLENAFNKFTKNKNNKFEVFLLNGFRKNCDFQLEKGKSLQEE